MSYNPYVCPSLITYIITVIIIISYNQSLDKVSIALIAITVKVL